jgi:hydrogenase maturation protease
MSKVSPPILIAGIGNIFLGDDGFGSEVAQRLLRLPWPPHVRVTDFGIRGLDLVYAMLDTTGLVILIDAVPRPDEPPGTLFVLEPDLSVIDPATPAQIDMHSMDPMKVLRAAVTMGTKIDRVLIVGCQPLTGCAADDDGADTPTGLSEPVAAAVDEAVRLVESLVARFSEPGALSETELQPQEVTP